MANPTPSTNPSRFDDERRLGPPDRRRATEDRRDDERVADDFSPRRDPELPDRRQS